MSDFETTARPYARAIFELANESSSLEAWADSMQAASEIASDEDMHALFKLPAMLASEKAEVFLSVFEGVVGDASGEFKSLINLLAENGRLEAIVSICEIFETLKQDAEGKIDVQVTSAQELTDTQRSEITESLAKRLGKQVSLTTNIDESLIAGAIIHAGDLVIDGSARGRLDKLSTALNK
ncbi:MAG: F-type H+-transporting ATPase subunit delta [Gammaproteobacteria bacterium]|jgi:F-type H+-transporting ATPase subunit delta